MASHNFFDPIQKAKGQLHTFSTFIDMTQKHLSEFKSNPNQVEVEFLKLLSSIEITEFHKFPQIIDSLNADDHQTLTMKQACEKLFTNIQKLLHLITENRQKNNKLENIESILEIAIKWHEQAANYFIKLSADRSVYETPEVINRIICRTLINLGDDYLALAACHAGGVLDAKMQLTEKAELKGNLNLATAVNDSLSAAATFAKAIIFNSDFEKTILLDKVTSASQFGSELNAKKNGREQIRGKQLSNKNL